MGEIKRRSNCPLSCALDIFGDKWTLLIIRDLLAFNKKTYKEFLASNEGISTNILANRLKRLVAVGILDKQTAAHNKRVFDYSLTEKGQELGPVILAMAKWGKEHFSATTKLQV